MLSPFAQQYLYSGRQNKRAASPNDGFGNLTQQNVTVGSAPSMSLTVNPANNRMTSFGSHDANGDQTVALNGLPIMYGGRTGS